ncbi:GlxA family transcriptional regulator [Halomonas sp. MA07-2]|uniref:GlxA family transcriptional regulator n=1 Tax=Halomonas sp. MA07-2 TaxID=3440841 RepID=UPI003EECFF94
MILKPDKDGVFTVSFLLLPEYAMVALLSAIEPMRIANRFAGREVFRWQLLSEGNETVKASNQLAMEDTTPIFRVETPTNLFVCSSFNPKKYIHSSTVSWLKSLPESTILGAMDTGCYLLSAAGLIRRRRLTLHWEAVPAFQEDHPEQEITNELYEIDRNLITCAGGTAPIDMMLHVIQQELGHDLAITVCEQFIKSGIRQKTDKQRIHLAARLNVYNPRLLRVLALMEENIESPLSSTELANEAHISVRQLQRLFDHHLQSSPATYYLRLRLQRARNLLKESHLSLAEVAIACGFSSSAHFTRTYTKRYQVSPSKDRG